jgi:hypothetical protein
MLLGAQAYSLRVAAADGGDCGMATQQLELALFLDMRLDLSTVAMPKKQPTISIRRKDAFTTRSAQVAACFSLLLFPGILAKCARWRRTGASAFCHQVTGLLRRCDAPGARDVRRK